MSERQVRDRIRVAQEAELEPPQPLMRAMPPAPKYPVEALPRTLRDAAEAIHDKIQAPMAICANSVFAAAALAVQGHCDIELPTGQVKPTSIFLLTVAASGERKTSADREALQPIFKRERALRVDRDRLRLKYANKKEQWDEARKVAKAEAKERHSRISAALDDLGPPPTPPLDPMMLCDEPTIEGLHKLLERGQPSVGIFASEGGRFIGGHGMSEDAKLRTAGGLSQAWDGDPIRRVRAVDGALFLAGRRVSMHLMAQPDVAALLLNDRLLASQGLLSRFLPAAPDSTVGTRFWKEIRSDTAKALLRYSNRLEEILETPLPLGMEEEETSVGTRNELAPRLLPLSPDARKLWIKYADEIERAMRPGGYLEPIRAAANKAPEQAARLAAIMALLEDLEIEAVPAVDMKSAIDLMDYYLGEARRLQDAAGVSPELMLADRTLEWLRESWAEEFVSVVDIYQRGPRAVRTKAKAMQIAGILEGHGALVRVEGPLMVRGKPRQEVWRIVEAV